MYTLFNNITKSLKFFTWGKKLCTGSIEKLSKKAERVLNWISHFNHGGDAMGIIVSDPATSDEKLKELIIYIAEKSMEDIHCGAIKLNKLLYYSDFAAYRIFGSPITGTEYQHLREGPAPRRLLPARRQLIEDNSIEIVQEQVIERVRERIIPKREHKSNLFSKEERWIVDEVVKTFWHMNGTEISKRSHEEFGWKVTKDGETIPYRTAWVASGPLSMEHIELGKEIAKRHGLLKAEVGA